MLFVCKVSLFEKVILHFLKKNQIHSILLRKYFSINKNINIGKFSYGCFTDEIPEGTTIGNYCSFASGIKVFNGNHGVEWATTHPFLYNVALKMVKKETIIRHQLKVGHDVWIGSQAIILPSVKKIGNGAVIGAGSVVTKEVAPYSIVAGNPAKLIRYRFDQQTIDLLERKKIYNLTKKELTNNLHFMYSKSQFYKINSLDDNKQK
ncbi:MAG: Virginiamycin A acetyltransferase [Polaribacter sejongensis]|nr:MAG: Virginiamycin A acetyltransferase [Polaribacter sejongensis]